MQFHLDGYKVGDPLVTSASDQKKSLMIPDTLPENVDVLIVGCGPAGLTLAAQLSAFPDITTRIIEQKDRSLELGQADGIACRTMEMFEAFNFSDRVLKEACWINEVTFWKPDANLRENIVRHGRIQDTEDGLSEFPHVVLNQARIHDFYLDIMHKSSHRMTPDYSRRLLDVKVESTDTTNHPVVARIEKIDSQKMNSIEIVRARYVVGCDGARSAVGKSIRRKLKGDSANQAWGVMDVLAVTDFPDIRFKVAIQSGDEGNLLIIPREGGYLCRLYVELNKLNENERISDRNITVDTIVETAQRILHPYTLDVKEVPWWSAYEIGQRISNSFDDVDTQGTNCRSPRIFIAGDACHTHSPKAGQGMNVSMQDTFNLGWKLASVIKGQCSPSILSTYSNERHAVAQELIDFDRKWARMISDRASEGTGDANQGVDARELQDQFIKHGRYTAGVETHYLPSIICAKPDFQHLANGFVIGTRFHSATVIRVADAKSIHLGHTLKADGRWRIFAFSSAQDFRQKSSHIRELCQFLEKSPNSPIRRYTQPQQNIDSVFDVRAIFQQSHDQLTLDSVPEFLIPRKGRYGLKDYEKLFCADVKGAPDIFDERGVDRKYGCLIIVRPDQYIANILPLNAFQALAEFFAGFMLVNH
ncbi:MAG: 2-polyprenyl-6-methoxyphenol hydroxylase-like FAD-dependent oxidoreductase [Gammaproteobacteria bacterium]|jgi:2-polyprenyl-6-methoxyphenol hydroxylase-like FAD-dependent oxidoreductase